MIDIRDVKFLYRIAGVRGALACAWFHLFGAPREIAFRPRGYARRLTLRLGTTDPPTYWQIFKGEYAFDVPFQPKVILDAGANIGLAAIFFANKYPDARIIAVEPEAENFDLLVRNCRPYPAIVPIRAAVWRNDGAILVREADPATGVGGAWAFVTREDGEGARVRAVTISTLMKEMNVESIDIAKIDIEGAEREVFEDASWAETVKCVTIELHDRFRPGCAEAVEAGLAAFVCVRNDATRTYLRKSLAPA